VFDKDIQMSIAAIAVSAAHRALADPTTDQISADNIIEIANKYLTSVETTGQIVLRQRAIASFIPTAERFEIIQGDETIPKENLSLFARLFEFPYPEEVLRKLAVAMQLAQEASSQEKYFAIIEVSRSGVMMAKLPWLLGFVSWTWKFEPNTRMPNQRDFFMIVSMDPGEWGKVRNRIPLKDRSERAAAPLEKELEHV
jgi:hypothetical protein